MYYLLIYLFIYLFIQYHIELYILFLTMSMKLKYIIYKNTFIYFIIHMNS